MTDTTSDRTDAQTEGKDVEKSGGDRAQYGMCAALAGLGILLLVNAAQLEHVTSSNDSLGPTVLGVLLLIVSVFYAIDIHRGGVGAADEGEDVDLGAKADWKTVGLLVLV